MRNKRHTRFYNKVNQILEVPREVMEEVPKFTIISFDEMLIENYKGILEYEEFYIKLSTKIGLININGFNLSLNEMTDEDLIITGNIESIDFESVTDEEE